MWRSYSIRFEAVFFWGLTPMHCHCFHRLHMPPGRVLQRLHQGLIWTIAWRGSIKSS